MIPIEIEDPAPDADDAHGPAVGPSWDAMVAHQLKTPLCALEARLSQDGKVDRHGVRRDIRRMTHLIDQLQSLARCRSAIEKAPRSVGCMVQEVCVETAPLAMAKDQRMGFRDLSRGRKADIDEDLAREAVRNIVENAIKYSERGGPIDVVVLPCGTVCVLDRGPGIVDRDRAGMFDAFRRGAAARDVPGTGLGLHLVKEVMRMHGGQVRHGNRRSGGSVFVLRFSGAPVPERVEAVRRRALDPGRGAPGPTLLSCKQRPGGLVLRHDAPGEPGLGAKGRGGGERMEARG